MNKKIKKIKIKMACVACLAAPLAVMGVGSVYFNTLLGLLLTIFFCSLYIVSKKECKMCSADFIVKTS